MAKATLTAEDHVRAYLVYLTDPESLRDAKAVAAAETAFAKATDPIDRVYAYTALTQAETIDGDAYREGFVTNAKAWVEEMALDPRTAAAALRQEGVPDDVLHAAGLISKTELRAPQRQRKARGRIDLKDAARSLPKKGIAFSAQDLADLLGCSIQTARTAITNLLAEEVIVDLGPDPEHTARGRAPVVYTRA